MWQSQLQEVIRCHPTATHRAAQGPLLPSVFPSYLPLYARTSQWAPASPLTPALLTKTGDIVLCHLQQLLPSAPCICHPHPLSGGPTEVRVSPWIQWVSLEKHKLLVLKSSSLVVQQQHAGKREVQEKFSFEHHGRAGASDKRLPPLLCIFLFSWPFFWPFFF